MYMYVRNAMNGVGVGTNDYEYPILMLTTMNWPMPSMTNIYTMQLQKQLIWAGALKTSPLLTTNADSAWCQLLRVGTQTTSQPGAHLFSLRLSYRGIGSSSRSLMSQLASASCNRNTHNVRRRADIAPSRTQILPWHCLYLAANIVLICKGRECK